MEVLMPGKIEPVDFKIETLWDSETGEKIETVNPGKAGQTVLMKLPIAVKNGWILRRKK